MPVVPTKKRFRAHSPGFWAAFAKTKGILLNERRNTAEGTVREKTVKRRKRAKMENGKSEDFTKTRKSESKKG